VFFLFFKTGGARHVRCLLLGLLAWSLVDTVDLPAPHEETWTTGDVAYLQWPGYHDRQCRTFVGLQHVGTREPWVVFKKTGEDLLYRGSVREADKAYIVLPLSALVPMFF
jgi:hypothetical protein